MEEIEERLVGRETDLGLRVARGRELRLLGRNEEALAELLFCFDESRGAAEGDRGDVGFVLGDLLMLSWDHTPARDALLQRADAMAQRLVAGTGLATDAVDLTTLNRGLGRDGKTLETYNAVRKSGSASRQELRALLRGVMQLLLKAERYQDVLDGVGDVFQLMDERLQAFEEAQRSCSESELSEGALDTMKSALIREAADFHRALHGVRATDAAARLADALIAFDPSGKTIGMLARTAASFEQYPRARALLQLGYEALAEEEHRALRRANRKLPKAERYEPR